MKVVYKSEINAPIEKVFELIEDIDKKKLWMDSLEEMYYTSTYNPKNPLGAKFKQKVKEDKNVIEHEGEVAAYNKPHHLGLLVKTKQYSIRIDYRLTSVAGGTRLDYTAELVDANWLVRKMATRMGQSTMAHQVERQMGNLKAVAETIRAEETAPVSASPGDRLPVPPRLMVHTPNKTWEVQLDKQENWTIGRAPENDIIIDHQKVSRRHARIERHGDKFIVQDLNSANGIWLEQRRIETHILHHDDTLNIGHAQLTFENKG